MVLPLALRHSLALADTAVQQLAQRSRELSMHNLHTDERLAIRYFDNGEYLPGALTRLNHLLRDHRSGDIAPIDARLFDQLYALALGTGCAPHYEIISGYRSPQSNESLRASSEGVARHSLHTLGRAIDVRPLGTTCSALRQLALDLHLGGVGYYAKSDFVHLDTGRVRSWTG
jgi:uncharacterized protein YcbK (DUF882 family)